ncbi:PhnA-like protein [Aurantimonas aggregata]|uniref:PhnA-like protein n=1 Tax=Aurantimonas aggregata TaxID=2047720 RepID=A0A6L9MDV9_9HYPH|nr:PhnA-like protein [Aurantimonas aggregata]NDV85841.1 PhnA-like protein [Aurantimonas aggregata]
MSDIRRDRDRTAALASSSVRRISWGAIAAGTLLALAIQFMLGLLGLGIGLSTIDPVGSGNLDASAFASAGGLWTVAVVLIGLFAGAFAAGRFAGQPEKSDAALHGAVTWAASTLLVIYLLTSSASVVLGGAFGAIGNSIQGLAQAAQTMAPGTVDGMAGPLRGEAEQMLRQGRQAPPAAVTEAEGETPSAEAPQQPSSAEDIATAIAEVVAGIDEAATPEERQAAVDAIAREAGIAESEARQRLQRFQQQYDEAVRQARQAADAAAGAVSTASFGAFIALLLGLVVGALGGVAGRPRRILV